MILLRVFDRTPTMYGGAEARVATLQLTDDVKCEKRGDCLVLIEALLNRKHLFNPAGEYIGTERLDKREWHNLGDNDPPGVE